MKTALLRPVLFLIGLNVIIKPIWIVGIDRQVQLLEGPEVYGQYFALFQLSIMFHVLLDAGIQTFLSQRKGQSIDLPKGFIARLGMLKIGLSFIYFGISLMVAFILGLLDHPQWLLKLLLIQILHSGVLFCRTYFTADSRFGLDRIFSVLDKIISLGIMAFALIQLDNLDAIDAMLNAQIIGLGLSILLALGILVASQKKVKEIASTSVSISYPSLLKSALPFALMVLFMTLYQRADGVMIALLHQKAALQNGLYAMSYRIYDALNVVPVLATFILLPSLSRTGLNNEKGDGIAREILRFSLTLSLVVAPIIFLNYSSCFDLLYGGQPFEAAKVFQVLMVCFLISSPMAVLGTILTASDQIWKVCGIALFGCLINITANYFLIPTHGALGASWTTLGTAVFMTLAYTFALRDLLTNLVSIKVVMQYLALGLSALGLYLLLDQLIQGSTLGKISLYILLISLVILTTKWLQISILPSRRN